MLSLFSGQWWSHKKIVQMSVCLSVLLFLLAGCGWQANSTQTGGSASSSAPTKTGAASNQTPPATMPATPTAEGCPSGVPATAPASADVVALASHRSEPVEAQVGNLVELRLAFGQAWGGPQQAPAGLDLQQPAGYTDQANKACVWRFVAQQAGTFNLDFEARAICKKGEMCAMYITDNPVVLIVKVKN